MDDHIVWKSAATREGFFFPFAGVYEGLSGVERAIAHIAQRYKFRQFKAREVVSAGETVWGMFEVVLDDIDPMRSEPSEPISFEMAIRWRVRNNKVVEHQAFFDTAALMFPAVH